MLVCLLLLRGVAACLGVSIKKRGVKSLDGICVS
jgi:hypothetical protein